MDINKLMETLKVLNHDNDFERTERYRAIIKAGRELGDLPEKHKTEDNLVNGCISKVWLISKKLKNGKYKFSGDSDALIVKGLVAILLHLYSNKTPEEISEVDIDGIFKELKLENHLTINRRNGFYAMVQKIKGLSAKK